MSEFFDALDIEASVAKSTGTRDSANAEITTDFLQVDELDYDAMQLVHHHQRRPIA